MNIGKYTLRSVKYFVKLVLLMALLFAVMQWSGYSTFATEGGGIEGFLANFFATRRGVIFAVAIVVWSIFYPRVEFVARHVDSDMHEDKLALIKAFAAGGMKLTSEDGDKMVFRGESPLRQLWWMGDEAVTVTSDPAGGLVLEGPRRFVMEAQHRIPGYIQRERES